MQIETNFLHLLSQIEQDGYAVVQGVLGHEQIAVLSDFIHPLLKLNSPAGVRNLAYRLPAVRVLAESNRVRALIEPILGKEAKLVRSVLFNKDQDTNWQVAWHQDLAIAVQSRDEVTGFTSWSVKEGITHVQPPTAILEKMLTVRLHLDAADENNGGLWVSPGSHRLGRIPAGEAAAVAARHGKILCSVQPGDVLMLRPLLLHASRKAVLENPRRVIHLEFAGVALPKSLAWHDAA